MKRFTGISLFCLLLMLSATFAFAADRPLAKTSLTLSKTLKVGDTELQPATYTLRWDDTQNQTQVQFFQGKKQVASAPAEVVKQDHKNDTDFQFSNVGGSQQLDRVFMKHETLDFTKQSNSNSGN